MSEQARRPYVWVTHERPNLSYTDALVHGDVKFLVPSNMEYVPHPTSGAGNSDIEAMVWDKLEAEYRPGYDFILLSGSPVIIFMAGQAAPNPDGIGHKILRWNNRTRVYDVVVA